jgi:hypothetical protein
MKAKLRRIIVTVMRFESVDVTETGLTFMGSAGTGLTGMGSTGPGLGTVLATSMWAVGYSHLL